VKAKGSKGKTEKKVGKDEKSSEKAKPMGKEVISKLFGIMFKGLYLNSISI